MKPDFECLRCCQRTLPLAGADEELALVERRIEAAELEQLRVRTRSTSCP